MVEDEPDPCDPAENGRLPAEVWLLILEHLDLATQTVVAGTCRSMQQLVSSLWRHSLAQISLTLKEVSEDHNRVRQKLVVSSMLTELGPLDKLSPSSLLSLLQLNARLAVKPRTKSESSQTEYEYFHDYDRLSRKYLELHQKWPRPGAKSLARFMAGNRDLVCLEVSDCRENIEAVHYFTSNCSRLGSLRLFATDPLLTYIEVLKLSQLRYLEMQFDTFYREHRDQFIYSLGDLNHLQVLKLPTCFGLTEQHVISLLANCPRLECLHLPFNSRINGWFLESLLEYMKSPTDDFCPKLKVLSMYVNTAYVELQTVIPELHVFNLAKEALSLGLTLKVHYCHKKLPSFNPKGFHY